MSRFSPIVISLALLLFACAPVAKTPVITPAAAADMIRHGYALINSGQPQEAIHLFDQVIGASPDNAAAYNGKAVAFDHTGNHLAAQELYQRALALAPDSLAVRNNLAMSFILNGQTGEAMALLEELNRQHEGNKTIRQNLALAYGLKGDVPRALELNLQDLPPTEAQENMKFYKAYAGRMQKLKTSDIPAHRQIGFAPAPASIAKSAHDDSEPSKERPAPPAPAAGDAAIDDNAVSTSFPAQRRSITY